jgi:hypothetical protein
VAFVSTALTAFAIVVAWAIFRLERFASRRRDIAGARAVLAAVQRGMIEGLPGDPQSAWGEAYFAEVYDFATAVARAKEAGAAVTNRRAWESVFSVPTEPLAVLATSSTDLISSETIFAANVALWRVRVFNQLVRVQDDFNARHASEFVQGDPPRLAALADATRELSFGLHFHGIGQAGTDEGWYGRLKRAVAADVERLGALGREGLWTPRRGERHLIAGDVLAALVAAAVIVGAVVLGVRAV